jgi:para-aminobenzoate synthetase component 1
VATLIEIPYHSDSSRLFEGLVDRPWAVFLDSGPRANRLGRYDILAADPYLTLTTWGSRTEVRGRAEKEVSAEDPFDLLRQHLGPAVECPAGLPFCGGALGWLGYDLGRRIERLPSLACDAEQLPEMAVGLYDWALIVDHQRRRSLLVSQDRDPGSGRRRRDLVRAFSGPAPRLAAEPFRVTGPVRSNLSRDAYSGAFARIKGYIRDGDCYQVNLAQRFSAPAQGDLWLAYLGLRQANPAPFSAFLTTPYAQVLSSSPERFLRVRGGRVETRPIKGTRPRGATPEEDAVLAEALAASPKERAENLMIVDLLRNDIGRVCRIGSVAVPDLFRVESFATVHHLVSTVTGALAPGQDALGLLRACFPGGSVTGAPKIRAMQIIEELEPHRRGIYCGALGYIGFDGNMDTNIAIRTLVFNRREIRAWAGGGIVHDSELETEYQETFHKASALLRLLGGRLNGDEGRGGEI